MSCYSFYCLVTTKPSSDIEYSIMSFAPDSVKGNSATMCKVILGTPPFIFIYAIKTYLNKYHVSKSYA